MDSPHFRLPHCKTVIIFVATAWCLLALGSAKAQNLTISTFAGSPLFAGTNNTSGSTDGTGSNARFFHPAGVAADSSGNVYVADFNNHTIRKITATGVVSTLAGIAGQAGSADGTGNAAQFNFPSGVAVDSTGNVYVSDSQNFTIRKITPAGVVTTLAGSAGNIGIADGVGAAALFAYPYGIALDSSGNIYVTEYYKNTIRKITAAGEVTTIAGSPDQTGSADGTGKNARFFSPTGVAVDSSGNLYVADSCNHTIRKITATGVVSTLAGIAGQAGSADGTGNAAQFNVPTGVTVDSAGNLYVIDSYNNTIRKITGTNAVTTVAGLAGKVAGCADGAGNVARFANPVGIAIDGSGNVYISDSLNNTIRKGN